MTVVEFKGIKKKAVVTPQSALLDIMATKPEKLICISLNADGDVSYHSTSMSFSEMAWYLDLVKLQLLMGLVT